MHPQKGLKTFQQEVETVFNLYNSLFLTLPFSLVKDTGHLLPFFNKECAEGIKKEIYPAAIIEQFFRQYSEEYDTEEKKINLLFRFVQYIERQVVLFDAIEESAFNKLNDMKGPGTIHHLINWCDHQTGGRKQLQEQLQNFKLRLVLTAHPTQYYPAAVLAIISDLREAIHNNNIILAQQLLMQLGKTPFLARQKPSPVDEAKQLLWYLKEIFYPSFSNICHQFREEGIAFNNQLLEVGFWPGGDRDGNQYVTAETTETVSMLLRKIVFQCYLDDARVLQRRLTFKGVEERVNKLIEILQVEANAEAKKKPVHQEIVSILEEIGYILKQKHDGLFSEFVTTFKDKVTMFGSHLASLDIRQDSRIVRAAWESIEKSSHLFSEDPLIQDLFNVIPLIKQLQKQNGERACHRFIISNTMKADDIFQLKDLFIKFGWKEEALLVDLVPLFESIKDLQNAEKIMDNLFSDVDYRKHIKQRGNRQVIMLGFSDSTKDGGYLSANWRIYSAKVSLSALADKHGISLDFFDGRGGPPSRGGGKTQQFYASLGPEIHHNSLQVTIQGQTISSQYGSETLAKYNTEQLLVAGLMNRLQPKENQRLNDATKNLLELMSEYGLESFKQLRNHPDFLPYLEEVSPLKLLSKLYIGSRPVKRNKDADLRLEDLRAISFVTSWSQLKQNVPGFFGMGYAFQKMKELGKCEEVEQLFERSGYFKALVDNCMMSLLKSDFTLTSYLQKEKRWKKIWQLLYEEYKRSVGMVLSVSHSVTLMENLPADRASIRMREKIILPLVVIQRYAWESAQQLPEGEKKEMLEKLALRTMHGIVNAGRNLA